MIQISSIGEYDPEDYPYYPDLELPPRLTCYTDLVACCRVSDTGTVGMGEWYYPDGRALPKEVAGERFYRVRNDAQVIRLARRISSLNPIKGPTGLYCCVIPTTIGEQTFCAHIGTLLVCK